MYTRLRSLNIVSVGESLHREIFAIAIATYWRFYRHLKKLSRSNPRNALRNIMTDVVKLKYAEPGFHE